MRIRQDRRGVEEIAEERCDEERRAKAGGGLPSIVFVDLRKAGAEVEGCGHPGEDAAEGLGIRVVIRLRVHGVLWVDRRGLSEGKAEEGSDEEGLRRWEEGERGALGADYGGSVGRFSFEGEERLERGFFFPGGKGSETRGVGGYEVTLR